LFVPIQARLASEKSREMTVVDLPLHVYAVERQLLPIRGEGEKLDEEYIAYGSCGARLLAKPRV
jgi:hypothetical protein